MQGLCMGLYESTMTGQTTHGAVLRKLSGMESDCHVTDRLEPGPINRRNAPSAAHHTHQPQQHNASAIAQFDQRKALVCIQQSGTVVVPCGYRQPT